VAIALIEILTDGVRRISAGRGGVLQMRYSKQAANGKK
jgi:hypothetical protein